MADDGYPYPGVSQIETAAEWEAFFSAVELDGVVSGLAPSIQSGARTASVGAGGAYLRGFYKPVTSTTAKSVPSAAGQDRVDRLVLRLDRDAANAASYIVPTVVTGTAGTGAPPALTRGTTGVWDLPISRWTSKADGSLTGLVDERYGPGWFTSAARAGSLVSASPARVAVETDTGQIYRSDGSTWTSVYQDTGDVSLPIDWPTVWTYAATPAVITARRVGPIVTVRIEITRINSALGADDPDGSQICTVPASMRGGWQYFAAQFTGGITARLMLRPDGSIWCTSVDKSVPVGRHLRQTITYMVP